MAENTEMELPLTPQQLTNDTKIIASIRNDLRTNIKISRIKNRNDQVDGLRIAVDELDNHLINLETFSESDVMRIAHLIKKQKHAQQVDLMRLCHAFLQSTENIQCFLSVTGAIHVVVKELTGTDTDTQILALECLCNLSLGSETSCEKVALNAGTYLITFVKSSNEWMVRTSIWCLTNLIAAGKKPLNVLMIQELIRSLINVNENCHNNDTKKESIAAIEMVISKGGKEAFKSTELSSLSEWILRQSAPIGYELSIVVYKFLHLFDFNMNDADALLKILVICFETLLHHSDEIPQSIEDTDDVLNHLILLVRICGNIVAVHGVYADYLIENNFINKDQSMSSFFNRILKSVFKTNGFICEIYWFIGNLIHGGQLSSNSQKYLESDEFLMNLKIKSA